MHGRRFVVLLLLLASALTAGHLIQRSTNWLERPSASPASAVPRGDQEIAWIDAATSGPSWERLVAAIHHVQSLRTDLRLEIVEEGNAFPRLTTAVPEVALSGPNKSGRLWIRWYKLSAETGIRHWVIELCRRDPPPLAIIGGGSSDRASALAQALSEQTIPNRPLLLITTATADKVELGDGRGSQDLMSIYPQRSFRFCFTNSQMAAAVIDFIEERIGRQSAIGPVFRVAWSDDVYSVDLSNRFHDVLVRKRQFDAVAHFANWLGTRLFEPLGPVNANLSWPGTERFSPLHAPWSIPYSVGGFDQPNRPEWEKAERVVESLMKYPANSRPLLCVTATTQPARRLLRGLERLAPEQARRFIVATGDSFDFNTVYRDRMLTWPIQDLPFELVFFNHRDPVDGETQPRGAASYPTAGGIELSGTEDLLLYADIVQAVLESACDGEQFVYRADELAARLGRSAPARFDSHGNRLSGTGEHVIHLRPHFDNGRVLPRATLEVWRKGNQDASWVKSKSLLVDYATLRSYGGAAHAVP